MFGKSCLLLIFCILVQSTTGSTNGNTKYAGLKTALGDKTLQPADQTFHINNWGCGEIERKLLTDIKDKIDSLSTGKGKLISFLSMITSSQLYN